MHRVINYTSNVRPALIGTRYLDVCTHRLGSELVQHLSLGILGFNRGKESSTLDALLCISVQRSFLDNVQAPDYECSKTVGELAFVETLGCWYLDRVSMFKV